MRHKSAFTLTSLLIGGWLAPTAADAGETGETDDKIIVKADYLSLDKLNAVKTPTPILDVPQSLSVISDVQIENQAFSNIGDVLRYIPGLSISQGEGHRDAINIRGNQTTADFFLDGLRDDVQYFRPLYNIEQIEILRGSNALLFGRGGGGGVINRVTKKAEIGEVFTSLAAGIDTFGAYQLSADTNHTTGENSAFRLNALYEEMANHRDAFKGERYAINPTFVIDISERTSATLFYEYLNDDRIVDRGVPSISVANGPDAPLDGYDRTFFGSADENRTTLKANILRGRIEHVFSESLRGNLTLHYADYDKLYQNLYPAGYDSATNLVTLDGYHDTTTRENVILQGNLISELSTGPIGHTLLFGAEYGDQETSNARKDNLFTDSNDDQISIALTDPLVIPAFSFATPVRDSFSEVTFSSLYLQDQIDLTSKIKLILGLRFDRFDVSVLDRFAVTGTDDGVRGRVDEEVSPRAGLIYKPAENISIYTSYSETFLPASGDQFLTLNTTTEDLQPQIFENTEAGVKWDLTPALSLTTAVFRLERGQFTTVDPDDASVITTVAGSTTEGLELQLAGNLTDRWFISTGYSYLDGKVEGGSEDGNATRQTPEHMFSLWNQFQATESLSVALGATYQDDYFVREDNAVLIPSYTRIDAAIYYDLSERTRLQINVENLLDKDYFPDAHSNDNISTGEPFNVRFNLSHRL